MKILKLTIKKKWFDMILSGEKKVEYRADTPFYDSRINVNGYDGEYLYKRHYDAVQLFNGGYFSDKLPNATFKIKGPIKLLYGLEKWGAEPKTSYWNICIGDLIEKSNCPPIKSNQPIKEL